jgi:hypothetical protein
MSEKAPAPTEAELCVRLQIDVATVTAALRTDELSD